jgi:hypothetical protein
MEEFCIVQVKHIYSEQLKDVSECILKLEASSATDVILDCSEHVYVLILYEVVGSIE